MAAARPLATTARALRLSEAERAALEAAGRRPYWRLLLPEGELAFDDLVLGSRRFRADDLGDPVVRREDGSATYLFASAVDDAELAISHVIRGEDHVTNTALQLAILTALGRPPPRFAHLPLIADAAGKQLSKRLGALSLRSLREQGVEPLAIVATLAALGTAHAAEPATDHGAARGRLRAGGLRQGGTQVAGRRPAALLRRRAAPPAVRGRGAPAARARAWAGSTPASGRPSAATSPSSRRPATVVGGVPPPAAARGHRPRAAGRRGGPFCRRISRRGFADWIEAVKAGTGRKGKALFQPLRLALTGREHGPELRHLLPLLGRERALARLRGETA